MKRYGQLFDRLTSFENLYQASRQARMGKRFKINCAAFEMNVEEEILTLQAELKDKSYTPGDYREFTIYERKPRKISAAPYRDRVVHHALCNIIEPILERTFIHDSYACRVGKGTHAAVDRFTEFARKYRYVLKTDIRKYFPSIDHELLYSKIVRKIKCQDTLWLLRLIIVQSNAQDPVNDYFPGDDLFEPYLRRRGIPIGNLTSQFFANVYLNDLDHFAMNVLQCPGYIRYVDDIAVFGDDKGRLWEIARLMSEFLCRERLSLHGNKTMVIPVAEGIDHLGYRIYPTHRRVRKDNGYRFIRKIRMMSNLFNKGRLSFADLNASVQSWIGHAGHADTYGLRRTIFEKVNLFRKQRNAGVCIMEMKKS